MRTAAPGFVIEAPSAAGGPTRAEMGLAGCGAPRVPSTPSTGSRSREAQQQQHAFVQSMMQQQQTQQQYTQQQAQQGGNAQNLVGQVPLVGAQNSVGPMSHMPGPYGSGLSQNQSQIPYLQTVGGLTPGAGRMQEILQAVNGLNGAQVLSLTQYLQEQVRQRGRGNPEFFGEMPHIPAHPFVVDSSSTELLTRALKSPRPRLGGLWLQTVCKLRSCVGELSASSLLLTETRRLWVSHAVDAVRRWEEARRCTSTGNAQEAF